MSPLRIHHFESVTSTNDVLRSMVDAPELTCVSADQQTSGRGRRSRSWVSSKGDGLYLSILLRPQLSPKLRPQELPVLGLMSAVVVVESLAPFGIAGVDIKWPNDVLIENRKVAGILAEVVGAGDAQRVIVGVGVNLNHAAFPDELAETATSVRMAIGQVTEAGEFRTAFLDRFQDWYLRMLEKGSRHVIDRWQDLSSYAHGRRIAVTVDDRVIEGDTAGLTSSGALRLRTLEGKMLTLIAGDVSSVRVQKT